MVFQVLRQQVRPQIPERRLVGVLRADVAGRVEATTHLVQLAVRAARAVGRQPAVLLKQRAHAGQHAAAHALGQLGIVGEQFGRRPVPAVRGLREVEP